MPSYTKRRTTKRKPFSRRTKPKTASKSHGRGGTTVLRNPRPTVQKGFHPFGLTFLGRLVYSETASLSASSVTSLSVTHQFRINSMYDPNVAVGGHQPMQFDQLMAFYKNYLVYAAKIDLVFNNPSIDGLYVGYKVRQSSELRDGAGKTVDELMEMRDTRLRRLNNTGSQKTTYSVFVPMHIPFGITKSQLWNETTGFSGTAAADSTQQCILDVIAASRSTSSSTDTIDYTVKIRYFTKFFNPIGVVQS